MAVDINSFVFEDSERKCTWYLTDYKLRYDERPQCSVAVSLANNLWAIGTIVKRDGSEAWTAPTVRGEWHKLRGAAQKQPKAIVRDPIEDYFKYRFCEEHATQISVAGEQLANVAAQVDGGAAERMRTMESERKSAVDRAEELEREVERLSNEQRVPTIDELLMQTLVGSLKPAIDAKVAELSREVVESGRIPVTHRIKIADKIRDMDGIFNEVYEDVLTMVANGESVFLTGPAGTGKNVLAEQVAQGMGLEFYYMGQVMDKYTDCVGFADANGNQHDTPLIRAARNGGVLFIDEIDASIPEVLITVNALLANGYFVTGWGEVVNAHDDFHVLCAGNTVGTGADNTYTGRYQLDAATLDRFQLVDVWYDHRVELAVAGNDEALVSFVECFRKVVTKDMRLPYPVTYRATKSMAKLNRAGMDLTKILRSALIKSLGPDDVRMIQDRMLSEAGMRDNEWHKALTTIVEAR